jgi:hypothetical protein
MSTAIAVVIWLASIFGAAALAHRWGRRWWPWALLALPIGVFVFVPLVGAQKWKTRARNATAARAQGDGAQRAQVESPAPAAPRMAESGSAPTPAVPAEAAPELALQTATQATTQATAPSIPRGRPTRGPVAGMFQKRRQRREAIAELRALAAGLPDADGVIGPDGFRQFFEFVANKNIDLDALPDIRREVRLGLAQGGYFLETDTSLLLKKDEAALLEAPVTLLKEVTDRQFRGGSQGVSIPLGHGVRYRAGAYRGHMVTIGTHWEAADTGQLTVTDSRVVYHGGRKTLEFPFSKLATLDVYKDAIDLGVTSRQSTSPFRTGDPELIAGIIRAAFERKDDKVTIIKIRLDEG